MRSLMSRNSFKTPFSQKRHLTLDGKKTPCTISWPYQLRHEELSPLHLGGRIQTVTPKTRKQIIKKLASSMQRQNVTVSSAVSSPGITFPFDSQPDPKAALNQSNVEEDATITTLTEDGLSGEEFDLELSPGNSEILRPVQRREYVKNKSDKKVSSYDRLETTDVISEIVIPDEEHAYELICTEAGKESDDTYFKSTVNEEGMKENPAVIIEVNKLDRNDCRKKENMNTGRIKKASSNKKISVENKTNSKKVKGKTTEPKCTITKKAIVKMKAMSPDAAISERKKKADNSVLTTYVATVQSLVKQNKLKLDKLKKNSSNTKNSTQQRYKSKMEVKQDVVKMIRKMHLEIERLLKKRPDASKIGSTTKASGQSGMILLTEE